MSPTINPIGEDNKQVGGRGRISDINKAVDQVII